MANTVNEAGAVYASKLAIKNTTYTLKDEWARAEIEEVKGAISGGVHFRGITETPIADGEALKNVTMTDAAKTVIGTSTQLDGDIFIYQKDGKNLEFVVCDGHYSEFGSTGELGALAFADKASGSVSIPIKNAITFNEFTPDVKLGTLAVDTTDAVLGIGTEAATASGTFSPAPITIPEAAVTMTPTKSNFTAFNTATYDEGTLTLTIGEGTSDSYMTNVTGSVAKNTIEQTADQAVSVSYDKATSVTGTAISAASLTGDLAITASTPTATIEDPTVTVTVTADAD